VKYSFACLCVSRSSIEGGGTERRVYLGLGGVLLFWFGVDDEVYFGASCHSCG